MLRSEDSPLRLLVKSYANGLVTRDQYLKIRSQVLKKLAAQSEISHDEVKNFIKIQSDTGELRTRRSYSLSDWVIVGLGLLAAATLASIFFF